MKKVFFYFLFFIAYRGYCQSENRININYGFCKTDLHSKLFVNQVCIEPCFPTEQNAETFFDINILYEKSIGANFFIPIGIGFNKKGFHENGLASDGTPDLYPYERTFAHSFFGFYLGLSYDVFTHNKIAINISQLLNPEFQGSGELFKAMPISARTTLSLGYNLSEKIGFRLTPFYQTALSPYNENKLVDLSSDWKPYGFGINIGMSWFLLKAPLEKKK